MGGEGAGARGQRDAGGDGAAQAVGAPGGPARARDPGRTHPGAGGGWGGLAGAGLRE